MARYQRMVSGYLCEENVESLKIYIEIGIQEMKKRKMGS